MFSIWWQHVFVAQLNNLSRILEHWLVSMHISHCLNTIITAGVSFRQLNVLVSFCLQVDVRLRKSVLSTVKAFDEVSEASAGVLRLRKRKFSKHPVHVILSRSYPALLSLSPAADIANEKQTHFACNKWTNQSSAAASLGSKPVFSSVLFWKKEN